MEFPTLSEVKEVFKGLITRGSPLITMGPVKEIGGDYIITNGIFLTQWTRPPNGFFFKEENLKSKTPHLFDKLPEKYGTYKGVRLKGSAIPSISSGIIVKTIALFSKTELLPFPFTTSIQNNPLLADIDGEVVYLGTFEEGEGLKYFGFSNFYKIVLHTLLGSPEYFYSRKHCVVVAKGKNGVGYYKFFTLNDFSLKDPRRPVSIESKRGVDI